MQFANDYRIFFTRNSEYHLRGHICIGVRDRRSGRWFVEHPALLRPLHGALPCSGGSPALPAPNLGEPLEFSTEGGPIRTSPVLNIEERDVRRERGVGRMHRRPLARNTSDDPRVTR